MTKWCFWGDKKFSDVYENIYTRTFIEDWFKIIFFFAKQIKGKNILDIGCGEGHTTKQILDRLDGDYICDLLEPGKNALASAKMFLSLENKIGKVFLGVLSNFSVDKKYDTIFTSHTNYYWASNRKDYDKQLEKLISMLDRKGQLLILTLPKESDHYNVMMRQIYPTFNYSRYVADFFRKKGLRVNIKRFRMRMYVGDILLNSHVFDLHNFYRFIHNTDKYPSIEEGKKFLRKIRNYQKGGYLDFKDELIIAEKN